LTSERGWDAASKHAMLARAALAVPLAAIVASKAGMPCANRARQLVG
jgi:hypothetical protein